ncbi:MAG: RNA polymerase sigma factor [Verrucomicrobia bacterium]|nr:RNA polymerase sigma factor [Verrucomicrobiota bacterium]
MKSDRTHESPTSSDWQRWLAEHAPKFLLFARQQARSEADAQDLVQEAVLESWQRQSDAAPPPLGLVFATIRRRAIDLARSENRRARRESAASDPPEVCWFDSGIEDRERSQLIQAAVQNLPDIYRDVISLKVWGELTFAEIAEALDIPANTAASRYRYALAELRKRTKEVLA